MFHALRRIGIVVGSLVAAWLVVWLVTGSTPIGGVLTGLVILVIGGLIYRDIVRRETRAR